MVVSTLVLEGGRVIDPATGYDAVADVVIEGDRVAAIGPDLGDLHQGGSVIDCAGMIVTPGLIDLHVHVYPGLGDFCHPDRLNPRPGPPSWRRAPRLRPGPPA